MTTLLEQTAPVGVDNAIQIEQVNAWYGEKQVLFNTNLRIQKNRITALIGPSGCGKTTLLRSLNRMNDIIKTFRLTGIIKLGEEDIYAKESNPLLVRKKVGMVFQRPNPFPMSIRENLRLPIVENTKITNHKELDAIIEEKLKATNLYSEVKDRMNESALNISGGQQQRLCIARALTINPEIILFDEPCSALDPISTMKIEELLLELKKDYTVVIVTHNLEQARRIADYVAFFYNGEIVEQGESNDIFINCQTELLNNYLTGRI